METSQLLNVTENQVNIYFQRANPRLKDLNFKAAQFAYQELLKTTVKHSCSYLEKECFLFQEIVNLVSN